jgi:hypothetical protein
MITILVVMASIGLYFLLGLLPFSVRIIIAASSIVFFYKVVDVALEEKLTTKHNVTNDTNSATNN